MDSHKSPFFPRSAAPPETLDWEQRGVGTGEPAAAGGRRDLTGGGAGGGTDSRPLLGKDYSRCSSDSPTSPTHHPALNVVNLSFSSPGWGYQSFSDFPGETSGSETNAFIS